MTDRASQAAFTLVGLVSSLGVMGCLNRDLAPAEPGVQSGLTESIRQTGITKVDILFVIDNSNSMKEEQKELSNQIRTMIQELLAPATVGPEAPPAVSDLHIGIVSSDIGAFGYSHSTCVKALGDDGLLQNTGRIDGCDDFYTAADCPTGNCPWLVHSEAYPGNDPGNSPIWEGFKCIATLGTGGCGFEQHLEASRRALDPAGHASATGMNAGFVRPDSLLAIVYVADEDDCSSDNPAFFGTAEDGRYGSNSTRCAVHPEQLIPVEEYYNFFVNELRGGDPELVVMAAIVGLPDNTNAWSPGQPPEALRRLIVLDPDAPQGMKHSCSSTMGDAFHPVRFVELAYLFGRNAILQSICQLDWRPALRAITRKIQDKIKGVCTDRALASTSPDVCRVVETLYDASPCPNVVQPGAPEQNRGANQWRRDLGLIEVVNFRGDREERRLCEILPADYDGNGCPDGARDCGSEDYAGSLNGWFYDTVDRSCDHGQVKFTNEDITSNRSNVRFECLTAVCPERRQCGRPAQPANHGSTCPAVAAPSCGAGQVAVRHNSKEMCGYITVTNDDGEASERTCTCVTCEQTIGAACPYYVREQPPVAELPLIDVGGCCAEGFHCEQNVCQPNRTTNCR